MAEDRRAALGLVAADPLEDAGAVVEAVAENVDLGVVPGDELAVHPDPLGLLHGFLHSTFIAARSMPEESPSGEPAHGGFRPLAWPGR